MKRSSTEHPTRRSRSIQVAVGVIQRKRRYLICQRRDGDAFGGYWEFPGGKRLPGERWERCLRRELQEELGVQVRVTDAIGRFRYRYPDRAVYLRVFRCAIVEGKPRPIYPQALAWVTAAELRRYRFPPANRALLQHLGG